MQYKNTEDKELSTDSISTRVDPDILISAKRKLAVMLNIEVEDISDYQVAKKSIEHISNCFEVSAMSVTSTNAHFVTVEKASMMLKIGYSTLTRWLREKKLDFIRPSKVYLIPVSEIERLLKPKVKRF